MSFWGFLTGKSETAEKVIDGVVSGLDMLIYTPEEKAIAGMKILDWKLDYAKATAAMSISRRVITCAVTALWVVLVILLIIFGLSAGKDSVAVVWLFKVLEDIVNPPFMIIVAFYFLAHVIGNARK